MSADSVSITDSSTPSTTLSVSGIAKRYLAQAQRLHDIAAYLGEGARHVTERAYDEAAAAVGFQPAVPEHRKFDPAKDEATRWLARHIAGDLASQLTPLLEDTRTLISLAQAQSEGRQQNQGVLETVLRDERRAFLALDLPARLTHLQNIYNIATPLSAHAVALARLAVCLGQRNGVVSEKDISHGGALVIGLLGIKPKEEPDESGQVTVTETRRTFSLGETIALDRNECLALVTTFTLFTNALMQSLRQALAALKQQPATTA